MKKYDVTVYYENWDHFQVEAESEEEARDKVLSSDDLEPIDSGDNGVSDVIIGTVEEG
jgi:hypothetical protein